MAELFVAERQKKILDLAQKFGKVKVKELSEQFAVTEDCIRKDLAILEKCSLLERVYGGAILARTNLHLFEVEKRKSNNLKGKLIIAKKAIRLLQAGDTVFLDISTINIEVAKLMTKSSKAFTVVTNMIEVLNILCPAKQHKIIFIGGELNKERDAFCGAMTIQILSQFNYDIAFMGTTGIDVLENGVSTYIVDDGLTKAAILKASRKAYLLAEAVKFGCDGNYKYAFLSDFAGIIVDESMPAVGESIYTHYGVFVK